MGSLWVLLFLGGVVGIACLFERLVMKTPESLATLGQWAVDGVFEFITSVILRI